MAAWLIRSTLEVIDAAPPSDMAARFGGSWVDAEGNAITNALGIFRPDLSAVEGQPRKYWKLNKDSVELMTRAEMDAVDAAEKQASLDSQVNAVDWDVIGAILVETGAVKSVDDIKARYRATLEAKGG